MTDPNFLLRLSSLDYENFPDSDMLEAFVFLNLPELDIDIIRNYSQDMEKLIVWCQAVISYHILIHPYTYRNEKSQISNESNVYEFAIQMSLMINRFYKFKRFLYNLNIVKIPLGDYVFNLQHTREKPHQIESISKYFDAKNYGRILSYLPLNTSYKFISVNKQFKEGFKVGIDMIISEILKEIYFFKAQAYDKMSKKFPMIYDNNIFSKYFFMLDDILNSECNELGTNFIPFLSKEQLNDIKNIKIESDLIRSVSKAFCIICDEKPDRRSSPKGEIKVLYLEKVKILVINGKILKTMRNVNKIDIQESKIKAVNEELQKYSSLDKLEEIKRINRGVYQLLIWELYVLEYLKAFNPFDLINFDYIKNRYADEEIEMLKYYKEIINYLKYNLKVRFYFSGSNVRCSSFDLMQSMNDLKDYLISQNMYNENLFDTSNPDLGKIAGVYFESKDLIPIGAKPALYERILSEIISCVHLKEDEISPPSTNVSVNMKNPQQQQMQLGAIKEEQFTNGLNKLNHPYTPNIQSKTPHHRSKGQGYKRDAITIEDLPTDLIIKHVLFFLDINSLPKFALVNHKMNDCIKTHIFIRLFFLNKEKKLIEEENDSLISSIHYKRSNFFQEYEVDPPNKEHAYSFMNQISSDDIMEIKQCFKKYNKNLEIIISPLVLLMGSKSKMTVKPDGSKVTSYFQPAQSIIFKKDFVKRIRDLELETIPNQIFKSVEAKLESSNFSIDKIKLLSPCLHHLISWIMGVIEFHRVIRKYSLSSYDYDILDENEIAFCSEMDNIILLYYKLLRYATKHCKMYEKEAQRIMNDMNVIE